MRQNGKAGAKTLNASTEDGPTVRTGGKKKAPLTQPGILAEQGQVRVSCSSDQVMCSSNQLISFPPRLKAGAAKSHALMCLRIAGERKGENRQANNERNSFCNFFVVESQASRRHTKRRS